MSATAVDFSYHDVGCRCLRELLAAGVDVKLVVTHRDDPGETIWFGSVATLARERGLAVQVPDDPGEPAFVARLAALAPDFLSFYYRRMLSPAVLATARRGAFNLHGSLLPKYRGRVPVNWAVIRGERETGATLHEMVAKPDARPTRQLSRTGDASAQLHFAGPAFVEGRYSLSQSVDVPCRIEKSAIADRPL